MTEWTIFIPGRPIQKGNRAQVARNRGGRAFIVPSDAAKKAEKRAKDWIGPSAPVALFEGPVVVDVTFVFRIPKTGDNRHREPGDPCLKKVDRGNLLKLIEDAMSGLVYVDDSQVCGGDVRKVWGSEEGTHVTVRSWS